MVSFFPSRSGIEADMGGTSGSGTENPISAPNAIPKGKMVVFGETRQGAIYVFSCAQWRAERGVLLSVSNRKNWIWLPTLKAKSKNWIWPQTHRERERERERDPEARPSCETIIWYRRATCSWEIRELAGELEKPLSVQKRTNLMSKLKDLDAAYAELKAKERKKGRKVGHRKKVTLYTSEEADVMDVLRREYGLSGRISIDPTDEIERFNME